MTDHLITIRQPKNPISGIQISSPSHYVQDDVATLPLVIYLVSEATSTPWFGIVRVQTKKGRLGGAFDNGSKDTTIGVVGP